MKEYAKNNPIKMILSVIILAFSIVVNIYANDEESTIGLTIGTAIATLLINFVWYLRMYGEYKEIEGFFPAIKALFKW